MELPAWTVKKPDEDKEKKFWNAFNLVPTVESDGMAKGMEWNHKIFCQYAANGNFQDYERLYKEVPASDVFDYLTGLKAINY
jgi:hypothetical protein